MKIQKNMNMNQNQKVKLTKSRNSGAAPFPNQDPRASLPDFVLPLEPPVIEQQSATRKRRWEARTDGPEQAASSPRGNPGLPQTPRIGCERAAQVQGKSTGST